MYISSRYIQVYVIYIYISNQINLWIFVLDLSWESRVCYPFIDLHRWAIEHFSHFMVISMHLSQYSRSKGSLIRFLSFSILFQLFKLEVEATSNQQPQQTIWTLRAAWFHLAPQPPLNRKGRLPQPFVRHRPSKCNEPHNGPWRRWRLTRLLNPESSALLIAVTISFFLAWGVSP